MRKPLRIKPGAVRPLWRQTSVRPELRTMVLEFLANNENPTRWTFYRGVASGDDRRGADIILDVGGRIAYVDVSRQGGGGLGKERKAGQVLASRRGAACFIVRSVPDMERVLRDLGVALKPKGRMFTEQNINTKGAQ